MFYTGQRFMFVTKYDRDAIEIGRIVERVIERCTDELKELCPSTRSNDHQKYFDVTDSWMYFHKFEAACGRALTHLVIDEAAFIGDMDQHWKALYPMISTGGKCFVVSTVNGAKNWFAKTYQQAETKENEFKIFECSYLEHPDYQDKDWIEQTRKNLGEKGWSQEVEGKFI